MVNELRTLQPGLCGQWATDAQSHDPQASRIAALYIVAPGNEKNGLIAPPVLPDFRIIHIGAVWHLL